MNGTSGLNSPTIALAYQGSAEGVATDTTGDKWIFTVPFKCELVRSAVVVTGASTHATTFIIKLDVRPTAGSDTSRGDGDGGVLKKTTSNLQGKFLYWDPTTRVTLTPGQQVVVEVTTANGDACTVVPVVLVREVPEVAGNITAMQVTT